MTKSSSIHIRHEPVEALSAHETRTVLHLLDMIACRADDLDDDETYGVVAAAYDRIQATADEQ
jgi:hypothetical protein